MALELAKALVRVRAASGRLAGDLAGVRKTLSSGVAKIGGIVAAGIGTFGAIATVKKSLNLAADLEQTTVAFETMLGSADKAKMLLQDLDKFAATTPFQLPGLQDATKKLISFGVSSDDVLPTLRMLGDISSGSGKDLNELALIFGKIKANQKLQGDELNQLMESNALTIADLGKALGVADNEVRDLVSKGKVGFEDVQRAMQNVTGEGGRFNNMMAKQSTTFAGLFSTLKDNIDAVFRQFGTQLLPVFKPLLEATIAWVNANREGIADLTQKIANFVGGAVKWVVTLATNWRTVWEIMKTSAAVALLRTWDFIKNVFFNIPTIASAAFTAMIEQVKAWGGFVVRQFNRIVDGFKLTVSTIRDLWNALWTGGDIMGVLADFGKGVVDIQTDMLKDLGMTATTGAREFWKGIKDIDFFKPGEATKALQGDLDRLMGDLFAARARMDQTPTAESPAAKAAETSGQAMGKGMQTMLESGRFGFAEIGEKIQEKLLGKDDKQQKMVNLLEAGNKKQDELINAVKESGANVNVGLT